MWSTLSFSDPGKYSVRFFLKKMETSRFVVVIPVTVPMLDVRKYTPVAIDTCDGSSSEAIDTNAAD